MRVRKKRNAFDIDVLRKNAYPFGCSRIERTTGTDRGVFVSGTREISPALPGIDFTIKLSRRGDRSGMGDSIVASHEPKHFEPPKATAPSDGTISVSNTTSPGWTVWIGSNNPPENESLGNGSVLFDKVKFPKWFSRNECAGSHSQFFIVVIAR